MTKYNTIKTARSAIALLGMAVFASSATSSAMADKMDDYKVGDIHSGYVYTAPSTRAMQDDDFENPAFLMVEKGEALWSKPGPNGKSCASCHENPEEDMKGVSATYPKYDPKTKKMMTIEQKINREIVEKTGGKKVKWEKGVMPALSVFIGLQSRGMPMNVKIDGEAAPFYEKGKKFYYTRRGQLNIACKHCHEDYAGKHIRADLLSQGMANGFPAYRLKWQKVGSLHRRFRGCNKNIRAEPYKQGAEEYVNLELYVKSRGNGLKMEIPAVRR